eukprot:scaffold42152_cov12-Tisochrysis_lutea.AAC.1
MGERGGSGDEGARKKEGLEECKEKGDKLQRRMDACKLSQLLRVQARRNWRMCVLGHSGQYMLA